MSTQQTNENPSPPLCSTDLLGDTAILQRRMPLCMVGTYREWHDCNASDIDARIKTERDMVLWSESETNDRVKYRVIRRKETVIWSPNAAGERPPANDA